MQTRRYQLEWMLLLIMLLSLGAFIGYWLYDERTDIEAREQDRLQVQARVIDENLGRQLAGANNALAEVRDEFPPPFSKSVAQAASRHLKALSHAMPGVRTMFLADADGNVVAANRGELIGLSASEREYFRVPRERPDPALLYVSPPFRTTLGVYSINVVRVVAGSSGEFAGIVSATLDPEYFNVLLRSVLYTPDMWTSLAHENGQVFIFMPPNEQALGVNLNRPGSFRNRHLETGQVATVMTGTSARTGEERMIAQRTTRYAGINMDKTIGIAVSRDLVAMYLPWRRQVLVYAVLYALIAALAILGIVLFQRRQMAVDRLNASYATERRLAQDAARNFGRRLRDLSLRLLESEDTVRRDINRELHDRVGANLSAINLNLTIVRSQLSHESLGTAGARLDHTQNLIEETTRHVRDLMADLHPPALDDYGLLAAVRTCVHRLGVRDEALISISGEDLASRLPLAVETALFRVVQGALINAVTHAQAKRIQVVLAETADAVTLSISDDGAGFDVAGTGPRHASWGLAIMRERTEAIGAKLSVESTPGEGTRVRIEIHREKR